MFITFEGGEGTGKSTQVRLLAGRLRALGKDVLTTREPGGTPEAEALRSLLVSGAAARWTANEELLLNFAARGSHLRSLIFPALKEGKIIVCDRFIDSSYVYQCLAGGARQSLFTELVHAVTSDTVPNFTFILDIDTELSMKRANLRNNIQSHVQRADRYELKGPAFHEKIREGFIELTQTQPKRCHLIDASGTAEEVCDRVWTKLNG